MLHLANLLVALVALLHVWFLILEMFLWTAPIGLRTFQQSAELAASTAVLAANQGLYNGFLAAGLAWGLIARSGGFAIQVFFLSCVVLAGLFGAYTATPAILFIQALPAAIALALVFVSQARSGARDRLRSPAAALAPPARGHRERGDRD